MTLLNEETLANLEIYLGLTRSHADHVRAICGDLKTKLPLLFDPEVRHPGYQDVVITWGNEDTSAPFLKLVIREDGRVKWLFSFHEESVMDGSHVKSPDGFGLHKAFYHWANDYFCPPEASE